MTPDQLRREETNEWLSRAKGDLRALKAFLTFYQRAFRKTHDLGDLSRECLEIDDSLRITGSAAEGLTQYAWQFRYPGAPYEPDSTEARAGLQEAEAVLREIERRLDGGQPGE